MKIKKRKSLKTIKKNLDLVRKKIKKKIPKKNLKKKKSFSDIPLGLVNNAYASLILPRLKRLKYDHDKIIKPKPDIYINIKSEEVDEYYNLPNKIDLNGPYQAALYKMDIENTLDDYKGILSYVNLDNDNKTFNLIKTEINEVIANKANYIYKKENAKTVSSNINRKKEKIVELFNKLQSSYYKNQVITEYQKVNLLNINFSSTDTYKLEKIVFKFDEIDLLKSLFSYEEKNNVLTFSSKSDNYLIDFEQNSTPYWEINFIKGKDISDNKLQIKYLNQKINLIQPIYCDIIHNNVSNNNVLAYINIKNKYLLQPLDAIENISYFKVTQSNINRMNNH